MRILGYDAAGRLVYVGTPQPGSMYSTEDFKRAARRYYHAVRVEVEG